MKKKNTGLKTLIALVVLLAICAIEVNAQDKKTLKSEAVDPNSLLTENEKNSNFYFLDAVRYHLKAQNDSALVVLSKAIELDRKNENALFYRARINAESGKDSLALIDCVKAVELNPNNRDYKDLLGYCYLKQEKFDKAIPLYEEMVRNDKSNTQTLNLLLYMYRQERRYDDVLHILTELENINGKSEEYMLAKVQVYEMQGKKKEAYNVLKKYAEENKGTIDSQLMVANWLMNKNRKSDAFAIFSKLLKNYPEDPGVLESVYDYYVATNNAIKAQEVQNNILLNPHTPYETKENIFKRLILESEKNKVDSTVILNLLDKVIAVNPKDVQVMELKVGYMIVKKMPQDSINVLLTRILTLSPGRDNVRFELIKDAWDHQKWDDVIQLSKEGVEKSPSFLAFYYFLGLSYIQKDQSKEALQTLLKAVEQVNNESDPNVVADFYSIIGDLYEKQENRDKAFEAYEKCLEWNPNHINTLNNYAYFLSEKGQDLDKAASMSLKTVLAEPKNSTYLDTYAWILFMQKRYPEALEYIEKAVANESQESITAVVLEHAGDISFMANDAQKALEYWQKALAKDGNNKLLQQKIKEKKYIKE